MCHFLILFQANIQIDLEIQVGYFPWAISKILTLLTLAACDGRDLGMRGPRKSHFSGV